MHQRERLRAGNTSTCKKTAAEITTVDFAMVEDSVVDTTMVDNTTADNSMADNITTDNTTADTTMTKTTTPETTTAGTTTAETTTVDTTMANTSTDLSLTSRRLLAFYSNQICEADEILAVKELDRMEKLNRMEEEQEPRACHCHEASLGPRKEEPAWWRPTMKDIMPIVTDLHFLGMLAYSFFGVRYFLGDIGGLVTLGLIALLFASIRYYVDY